MAVIVLLSFLLLGGAFSAISYRFVINNQRTSMTNTAREALSYVSTQTHFNATTISSLEVRMGISIISRASGFDVIITDTNGVVVSCCDKELICPHIGLQIDSGALRSILAGREFSADSIGAELVFHLYEALFKKQRAYFCSGVFCHYILYLYHGKLD